MGIEIEVENIKDAVNAVCVVVVVASFLTLGKMVYLPVTGEFLWTFPQFCVIHHTIRSWRNPKKGKKEKKINRKSVIDFSIMCHWPS